MTYSTLQTLIQTYNIPENVTLKSDSGWEIDETDMDGVFYNPDTNIIVFTEKPTDTRYNYYAEKPWMRLDLPGGQV